MPEYRAYVLDPAGRIRDRIEFVVADDEGAIKTCRERLFGPFEIWQGKRFVIRSERDEARAL